jgi:hypothetical protein
MPDFGKIRLKFKDLTDNYTLHNRGKLDTNIQKYIDALNAKVDEENVKREAEGKKPLGHHTSCCYQVSHAFNATSRKIPASSFRRPNAQIPGGNGFYIGAVDEMEHWLIGEFGKTEDITSQGGKEAMKKYIGTGPGILVFRDGGAGYHVEFWNGSTIVQNKDISGNMSEDGIFSQPRVLFWEITDAADANPIPIWLRGWWSVYDTNQYYYYFSDQHGVTYTKTKPAVIAARPVKSPLNEGTVTVSAMPPHVIIDWNPADGGATQEKFTRANWISESEMNGTSNRYAPLFARKMS